MLIPVCVNYCTHTAWENSQHTRGEVPGGNGEGGGGGEWGVERRTKGHVDLVTYRFKLSMHCTAQILWMTVVHAL